MFNFLIRLADPTNPTQYHEWRQYRDRTSGSHVSQTFITLQTPDTPLMERAGGSGGAGSQWTPPPTMHRPTNWTPPPSMQRLGVGGVSLPRSGLTTPDPDYDNMSLASQNSPRAPRIRAFDQSSDTSCDEYGGAAALAAFSSSTSGGGFGGRYTPRSTASDFRPPPPRHRNSQPIGIGRGVSPSAFSEPPMPSANRRAPSSESFFGKNGASLVSSNASSQIWYQKYKHDSFSHHGGSQFGDPIYGAFDGRITNMRGTKGF